MQIPKLPKEKYIIQEKPLQAGEKLLLLPVPDLDTALIHVQMASFDGTCRIFGDPYQDIDLAFAAKHVVVTCEELVSNEEIRKEPNKNSIPGFVVDAVVHTPFGAHPTQCSEYYDYDKRFLFDYDAAGKTAESFEGFLQEWVYGIRDHSAYLDKLGTSRVLALKAVPGIGYSLDMTKREWKRRIERLGNERGYTRTDIQAYTIARLIEKDQVIIVGTGLPLVGASLAKRCFQPSCS
jgi:glutaconate CoA-transferase subunit A